MLHLPNTMTLMKNQRNCYSATEIHLFPSDLELSNKVLIYEQYDDRKLNK